MDGDAENGIGCTRYTNDKTRTYGFVVTIGMAEYQENWYYYHNYHKFG